MPEKTRMPVKMRKDDSSSPATNSATQRLSSQDSSWLKERLASDISGWEGVLRVW
jgi:hypothetical protein